MSVMKNNYKGCNYKLGLDLGATSIGWSVINSDSCKVIDTGVRIFDDGRDGKKVALCVARRKKRGARRRNKRRKMRMKTLINHLVKIGLLPEDEVERKALKDLNPYKNSTSGDPEEMDKIKKSILMAIYALRAKALDKKLGLYELGRIFLQLAKRRGFRSNRKDSKEDNSFFTESNERLMEEMKGCRTYGEYLYKKRLKELISFSKNPPQIRLKKAFSDNSNENESESKKLKRGVLFPFRKDYENEFDAIWDKQKEFYPDILTDENKRKIRDDIFFQRPLKEQEVGYCSLEPEEKRIPKAHPLFQKYRILKEVNNIRIWSPDGKEVALNEEQRNKLISILNSANEKVTITRLKEEKEFENVQFSNKCDKDSLPMNTTECAIRTKSDKLQSFWEKLDEKDKDEVISFLVRPSEYIDVKSIDEEDNEIIKYLEKKYTLDKKVAEELIRVNFEDGYANLSKTAIRNILEKGDVDSKACAKAGYNYPGSSCEHRDKLPYYGEILPEYCLGAKNNPKNDIERFGKISNATVHIALNQVRLLVNELIDKYGKPSDIVIEYARDLPASKKKRKEIETRQKRNREENARIRKEIKRITGNEDPSKEDIDKYKIWKSMHTSPKKRVCPYTGRNISEDDLFSSEFEVDHILPFSRTFDDSLNNKVICFWEANRDKGNRTPYEFWGDTDEWKDILKRIKSLNKERSWRFAKNAIERFEEKNPPVARLINDTRYMTKVLQQYLLPVVSEEGKKSVQAVPGQLTSIVRKAWGLNEYKDKENKDKYRSEHYHHAMDAIVIALLTREQIENINCAVKSNYLEYDNPVQMIKDLIQTPDEKCIKDIKNKVSSINISHKPTLKNVRDKNSTIGELHKDDAWGFHEFVDDKKSEDKKLDNDKKNDGKKSSGNKKNRGLVATFHRKGKEDKDVNITTYIPIFKNKKDRDAYFDAYKKWFIAKDKSKVEAKTKEEKKIKDELKKEEETAENNLREAAKKAFKWHESRNNFCIVIYEINSQHKVKGLAAKNRGEWESEVVSNYNATIRSRRNEYISYLPYKYPSSKKVMELHKNDMVMATFRREEIVKQNGKGIGLSSKLRKSLKEKIGQQDSITVLFRIKKITAGSSLNKVYFIPHDIAKEASDDDMCWATSSCKTLREHNIRKVRVSVAGDILDA